MKQKGKKNNGNVTLLIGAIAVIICVILVICLQNNKHDIYKFDFFDGYTPGKTYSGEINLTNGEVDYKIIYGCSLPNSDECPMNDVVKGKLNETQLELVKNTLEKNNRQDNYNLLIGVSYLIKGNEICDEETNETCEEIGKKLIEQ